VTCEERIAELEESLEHAAMREVELSESMLRKRAQINILRQRIVELSRRVAVLEGNQFPERWN